MAYQFADGFDNYGNAFTMVAGYPWDTISGTVTTSTADFRFTPPGSLPGACISVPSNNYIRKNLSGNLATLIIGFGFKLGALPGSGNNDICGFWDAGVEQVGLAVSSTGALQFFRGNFSNLIGSASAAGTVVANTWYGAAIQVTFATGAGGSVELFLNGAVSPTINSTGLNTSASGNAFANQVSLGTSVTGSGTANKYDDFYCIDTTGAFLNALLGGDARILTKMPSGAGFYTNWTPNGLASNFQNAAVTPPNIADFNANNTVGTKDSYAVQTATLGVAPYFVMARASLERDDAATHTPSLFVRSGATDSAGVVTPALTSSFVFYDAIFQNDPATTTAWTAAGADAAQVGVIEG